MRPASIAAVRAMDVLPAVSSGGVSPSTLVYNGRAVGGGPLHDPTALMYVRTGDLDAAGKLKPGVAIEPLVLRFRAGDCIEITLVNRLPATLTDFNGFTTLPMIVDQFNMNQLRASSHVGLSPQLNFVDVTRDDGINVGVNPTQTVAPGTSRTLRWYAGRLNLNAAGDSLKPVAIEWGATNLVTADQVKQPVKGLAAALIIEPAGATWSWDAGPRRSSATVYLTNGTSYREFVTQFQNSVNLQFWNGTAIENTAGAEDSEDSGQKGLNYRTEPMWFRFGYAPDTDLGTTRTIDFARALSNRLIGGLDPQTPIFKATAGQAVRFRVLGTGGNARNGQFQLHGHVWQELPWIGNSARLGSNSLSEWKGSQDGVGPTFHHNMLLQGGAGGVFRRPGDYLFRDQASFAFDGGRWGIFRVKAPSTWFWGVDSLTGEMTATDPLTGEKMVVDAEEEEPVTPATDEP